jgi:hypothetical protein
MSGLINNPDLYIGSEEITGIQQPLSGRVQRHCLLQRFKGLLSHRNELYV